MPHLSELHGAATHLAVVAVPIYLLVLLTRRAGRVAALPRRQRPPHARAGADRRRDHGDRAQGMRGPRLAGGAELVDFRHVHGDGLFPPRAVTDADCAAIDAWLNTLSR
jgi:hypothetical protein